MEKIIYKLESVNDNSMRYAAYDGEIEAGEITFVRTGEDKIIIDHTAVNDDYRGQKIGNELVRLAVEYAIENNKKVIPLCPFAKKEFEVHPEYREVEIKL